MSIRLGCSLTRELLDLDLAECRRIRQDIYVIKCAENRYHRLKGEKKKNQNGSRLFEFRSILFLREFSENFRLKILSTARYV